MHIVFCIGFLLCCLEITTAAKVLVFPLKYTSHIIYHAKMARILADEGHQVEIILPSDGNIPDSIRDSNVQVLNYEMNPTNFGKEYSETLLDYAMSKTLYQSFVNYLRIFTKHDPTHLEMMTSLMNDWKLRKHFDAARYDVAIVDILALSSYASLNFSSDIPVIVYGILSFEWAVGVPSLPSFVPMMFTNFDDRMSFLQRVLNTIAYFIADVTHSQDSLNLPFSVNRLSQMCSLYFALDDPAVSYPRPQMPNIVFVGDAIPSPSKQLPGHISEFVEGAEHGVVVVSFGTTFNNLPPQITDELCTTFGRIPQRVIWKQSNRSLCAVSRDKLLTLDWIPQNDLLGHKNVKLLITHCGKNSILEAVYHSTPIIGFPSGVDQPYNGKLLESRGFGYTLKLGDFTAEDLISKISDIFDDPKISLGIQRASYFLRNKSDKPAKRISYWVEHLAVHGARHLRSNALDLNRFQFYCLDIVLVLFIFLLLVLIIMYYCLTLLVRFSIRKLRPKKKCD